jgi:phenylpyruvate tautomerase PptA (4-oxalocrotonate tautomerase family)
VPIIEVKLYNRRVDADSAARIIHEMTEALVRACEDEGVRDITNVIVEGVPPANWGVAGKPGS